uniref:DNA ligase (NAD(+)) n=1 Tax=viral metagenome TaxID=1070528 RepID=A0A6C0GZT1_9ZZZZ
MSKYLKDFLKDYQKFIDTQPIYILIELASYAHEQYHLGEGIMSDKLYDDLYDEIKKRDPNNEFLKKVGFEAKKNKVELPYYMGSMDKLKTSEQDKLDKWKKKFNKYDYLVMDKLDGISGMLMKENKTIKFYTRGNGTVGQDITYLINTIPDLKIISKLKDDMVLRGEIIISKQKWKKYESQFSNARNMVSGLVNSKSINTSIMKDIDFVSYEIMKPRMRFSEQFKYLQKNKINTVYNEILDKQDLDFEMLDEILIDRREKSEYEVDGIIIMDDSLNEVNDSGNPDFAFAFKDASEKLTAEVKVNDVEWNVSKDGYIKPKLILEPTKLSGVIISNATAFNAKYIIDNKIGPGSIVKIIRSGDVIPHVLEVIKIAKVKLPEIEYKWNDTKVDFISIGNKSDEQIIKELTFFSDKMDIANLSEGLITNFVENNIDDIFKIINVTKKELSELDGFKEKLVNKIFDNIQTAMENATLVQFMNATNIFGHNFGHKRLEKVFIKYGNNFIKFMKEHTKEEITKEIIKIDGFDEITSNQFSEYIHEFIKVFEKIPKKYQKNIIDNSEIKKVSEKFKGKKFVFSGFRNKEWEEYIVINGGELVNSISKNTSFLITTKKDLEEGNNSKVVKAKEVGVEIVTKEDFEKKFL